MKQKYFFPLNYNYSGKIFGIIDGKLLLPLALYGILLFIILRNIIIDIFIKIIIFIFLFLPVSLLLNSRVNSEPFYTFIFSIIKHILLSKKYIFKRFEIKASNLVWN